MRYEIWLALPVVRNRLFVLYFSIFVVLRAYLHGGGLDGEFRAQAGALAHGLKRLLLTPPNTNYTFNG